MTTDLCKEIVYKDYGKSTVLTELRIKCLKAGLQRMQSLKQRADK